MSKPSMSKPVMSKPKPPDSANYLTKKQFYRQLLTIYGRKPVLEALQEPGVGVHRLHLASSNDPAPILDQIVQLAQGHGAEILQHSRAQLARISKNGRQDQGVAADLICAGFGDYRDFLTKPPRAHYELLALDAVTNPQNLGMIIRSVCAGAIDGLILPSRGCAKIDPLVIKASTGTIFKTRILRCDSLAEALADFKAAGCEVYGLSSHAATSIAGLQADRAAIYVLGNETQGVSETVAGLCDTSVSIPMNNGVESLNVAVAASLIAFRNLLRPPVNPIDA